MTVSFRHSEAFPSGTVFKLGLGKCMGFHLAKYTDDAKTWERADHGGCGEAQCGWSTGYEGHPRWMRLGRHSTKGSCARRTPSLQSLKGFLSRPDPITAVLRRGKSGEGKDRDWMFPVGNMLCSP